MSSFPNPLHLPQDGAFYTSSWTHEQEKHLLTLLSHEYMSGRWIVGDYDNNRSIVSVIQFNAIFHKGPSFNLPESFYQRKYLEWLHRFHLFHWLSLSPSLSFDTRLYRVRGPPSVWSELSFITHDVLYYSLENKLNWPFFCLLFKPSRLSFWALPFRLPSHPVSESEDTLFTPHIPLPGLTPGTLLPTSPPLSRSNSSQPHP